MKPPMKLFIFLVFAIWGSETASARATGKEFKVDVPHIGSIIGREGSSATLAIPIYQFWGIPYAAKPERFKAPTAFAVWTEPLDATAAAPACPEITTGLPLPISEAFVESLYPGASRLSSERAHAPPTRSDRDPEDCLTLDIHTPTISEDANLPVFLYIHGGAFVFGSSDMASGAFLIEHEEIVVVSAQYRLGPMGYLAAAEADAPGNGALHDLRWALNWTKTHVKHFGGNPEHIVVGGVSAGAALAGLLSVSPLTRNMMVGAALFSGGALHPWALDADPWRSARSVGVFAGCFDPSSLAACLRARSPRALFFAWGAWTAYAKYFKNHGMGGVIPSVNPNDEILPRHPREEMEMSDFKGKPMLIGITKHEGTFLLSQMDIFYMKARNLTEDQQTLNHEMGDLLVEFSDVDDHLNILGDAVRRLYFSEETIGNYTAMFEGLVDFTGAGFFKGPSQRMARLNAAAGGESYLYSFDYARENATSHFVFGGPPSAVHHGSDQRFLFPGKIKLTEKDHRVVGIYSNLVAKFVVNLKPEIQGVEWRPYSLLSDYYMSISPTPEQLHGFSDQFYIMETERRDQVIDTEPPTETVTDPSSSSGVIDTEPPTETVTDPSSSSGVIDTEPPTETVTDPSSSSGGTPPVTDKPSSSSKPTGGFAVPTVAPISWLLLFGSLALIKFY